MRADSEASVSASQLRAPVLRMKAEKNPAAAMMDIDDPTAGCA